LTSVLLILYNTVFGHRSSKTLTWWETWMTLAETQDRCYCNGNVKILLAFE